MKRKPNFGTTTYYIVTEVVKEGEEPEWMCEWSHEKVEEEDLEDWMETVSQHVGVLVKFETEKFTMQNRQYNKEQLYGAPYDDLDTAILDEDCPTCGHLMVRKEDQGNFCSSHECDYRNQELIDYDTEKEKEWKAILDAPPESKLREVGQTLEDFKKKYGFREVSSDIKACIQCKQPVEVSDFHRTKKYACILFGKGHAESCTNKGPAVYRPLGEEAKFWNNIL